MVLSPLPFFTDKSLVFKVTDYVYGASPGYFAFTGYIHIGRPAVLIVVVTAVEVHQDYQLTG
jgi:hypothetical protein